MLSAVFAAIALIIGSVWWVVSSAGDQVVLPHPRAFASDSILVDRTGHLLADVHPAGQTRLPVPLSVVAGDMQRAIVAIEDRNFWSEGAIDVPRLLSAAWNDLMHGSTSQGASTIPMQLAKLLYLEDNKSLAYKVREVAYASRMVDSRSKQSILQDYLNDSYFGHGATGVEAAAQVYFGITAEQLDLAQAALLAGLPNSPSSDDPFVSMDAAKARQAAVLAAMVAVHDITPAQSASAFAEKLTLTPVNPDNVDLDPFFVRQAVLAVQQTLHLNPSTAGLRITTTLDPRLQQMAQSTVAQQVAAVHDLNVTDGALVAVDPQSGDVVAYVGSAGPDAPGNQIDMASTPRQVGSSFKLYTYSTALAEKKISMVTPVLDGPISIPTATGAYAPVDYDHRWHGIVPVSQALGNSLNVPAVRVEQVAGLPDVVSTASSMGVTTVKDGSCYIGYSLTLGTCPVPLWQMAQGASVLADGGVLHPTRFFTRVTTEAGRVLLDSPPPARPALDPGAAFVMNAILTNDANRVMEFGSHSALTLDGHVVAAKTGTTQDFKDNLTVGWTPHLATATWVGNTDDSAMQGTTGITGAAPIWHQFMQQALTGVPDAWPAPPADVHAQSVAGAGAWFLNGTDAHTGASALTGGRVSDNGATGGVTYSGDCRYWTFDNGNYWYCGSGTSDLPGDPGPGGGTSSGPAPPSFSLPGRGSGVQGSGHGHGG